MRNPLWKKLQSGGAVLGTFVRMDAPEVVEIAGASGFDFVILDMEHGPLSIREAASLLRVAESNDVAGIVRVPDRTRTSILKTLDIGAAGLLCPLVESAADVAAIVDHARYTPIGRRGAALPRWAGYGLPEGRTVPEMLEEANSETMLLTQCETAAAVEQLDDVAGCSEVDGLFLGPMDLSFSMGIPGQIGHPRLETAIREMRETAGATGKIAGIYSPTVENALRRIDEGFRFVAVGVDTALFKSACRGAVEPLREALQRRGGRPPLMQREVRSILVVRLSALGDVINAAGIAEALRRRYPDAAIHWLVQEAYAGILEGCTAVDRVVVWPRGRWRRLLRDGRFRTPARELGSRVASLRREHYDLVLDLQGLWKSALWARLAGGKERIGLGSREGSGLVMHRVVPAADSDPRFASEYRDLLEELGVPLDGPWPGPGVSPAAVEGARRCLAEAGVPERYAVLAPCTTRPQKHWLESRWPRLADELRREAGLPAVVLGGPGDRAMTGRIATCAEGTANLAGETSVAEALAVVAGASLVVGVDTGLTHMGVLSGVPTVALFGATRPYLQADSRPLRVLYKDYPCSPCRRKPVCSGRYPCMEAISVGEVVAAAREVLP